MASKQTGGWICNLSTGNLFALHEKPGPEEREIFSIMECCYENGRSYEQFTPADAPAIEFDYSFALHRRQLDDVLKDGKTVTLNPMYLYHEHVWWCYGCKVSMADDGMVRMDLFSIGAKAFPRAVQPGEMTLNVPGKQKAPPTISRKISIAHQEHDEGIVLSSEDLQTIFGDLKVLRIGCKIVVPRSYFDVKALLHAPLVQPLPSADWLPAMLKGERVAGSDVVLTCGEGRRSDYHVHRAVLENSSHVLKTILDNNCAYPGCPILVLSHEARLIIPTFNEDDMAVLLTYLYKKDVILPNNTRFGIVGRLVMSLFETNVLLNFLTGWERIMVEDLLGMDPSTSPVDKFTRCFEHLIAIFTAPCGAFPVAKRVAISMAGDLLHMASTTPDRPHSQGIRDELTRFAEEQPHHTSKIMPCMEKFMQFVWAVEKVGVEASE